MDDWISYLVRQRQLKVGQIEFLSSGSTRLHETTEGVTTDVTADWLDKFQQDLAEISQILMDAGVPLEP